MKRAWIIAASVLVCGSLLWMAGARRAEVNRLKREQHMLLSRLASVPVQPGEPSASGASTVSPELLRLRSDVSQLNARKAGLVHVVKENQRLHAELRRANTNAARLAPGYIRRTEARMVGFGSPQATIETMLWALQNRDYDRFLEAFTPDAAERMRARTSNSAGGVEQFHVEAQALIGMGVTERISNPDGSIQLKIQVLPELPPADVRLVNMAGEWKLADGL